MKTITLASLVLAASSAQLSGQTHTHGSMVGSLRPTSVVVWTRASAAARVSALVNTSPSSTGAVETTAVPVTATNDFTAHIPVTGLTASTKYYYATRIRHPTNSTSVIGRWGTFTTPPTSTATKKVRFIASGDVFEKTQYGIFDKMRGHNAEFFLCLGDSTYSDTSKNQAEYWKRMKDTRNDARWLKFIEALPVEAMWDDHEVVNDWDKNSPANPVAWGTKAFLDYHPFPSGTKEIYRSLKLGKAAEVFLLDCRHHRDANATPSIPTKTMLGAAQKTWLKNALRASTSTFKILCSSIPVRYGKEGADDWSGFISERQEILDFILANNIQNVVILSADSHLVSVHHYREGVREYVAGPLAQTTPPQTPNGPEVRYRASRRNYLVVTADPTAQPATLTLEYFDANGGKLFSDTLRDEKPAIARVMTDLPNGAWQMKGPHYFYNRGDVRLPRVPPGDYRVSFQPDPSIPTTPTHIDLKIEAEADVVVSGRWREVPGAKALLVDTFDAPLSGYTIVDETTTNGPSAWLSSGGQLLQASLIGGPVGSTDSDRPGTHIVTGQAGWKDYTVATRFRSHDRGRVGLLFRYQDKNNFYRFFLDDVRNVMRFEKRVKGVYTTLAERAVPYQAHSLYDIRCVCVGSRLLAIRHGRKVFEVKDSTFSQGKVGLYLWNNRYTKFEDLVVTEGEDFRTPVNKVFTDYFDDHKITGWSLQDHAAQSGASSWLENVGVLMQLSNIGDSTLARPLAYPGTVAVATAAVPKDVQFTVDINNYDDDAFGVVFRYKDANNHYRFWWNRTLMRRELQKVVNGNWTVLSTESRDFNRGQWYRIRVLAVGPRLRLYIDGELVADVTDTAHKAGTVGCYSWRSTPVFFDRAIIQTPPKELPVLVAVTSNRVTMLHGRSPADAGDFYGLALSLSTAPGVPLSILNPTDPRVIRLAPDRLFIESFRPSPLWSNFFGKLDAKGGMTGKITWPNFPSLKGTAVYAAGFTGDITKRPIQNVFPTVRVVFP